MTGEARDAGRLSTEQVKVMFTGTHPQFYRPDQVERAGLFDAWLETVRAAGVAEGIRQAREAVAGGGPLHAYDEREAALERIDALGATR